LELRPESGDVLVFEARPHPDNTTTVAITVAVNCTVTLSRRASGDACFSFDIITQPRNHTQEETLPHVA
jgi:hypothetical protein